MLKIIFKRKMLFVILLTGIFLRLYKFDEFFLYGHDHDLAGWIIRDILENKHIRLIGQETSNPGVFIGPIWYYLLIPFYFLAGMDPIGGILLSTLVGAIAILSIYFVTKNILSEKTAIVATIIYACSNYTIFTDREIVPTTPAMLWSIWFLYSLWLIYKDKQKFGFLLSGLLIGLVWHINLALGILTPLILISLYFSKKRIHVKYAILGVAIAILFLSPFIVFEIRHGFSQTQSIISSVTTNRAHLEGTSEGIVAKFDRTMQLVFKNTDALFWGDFEIHQKLSFVALIAVLFYFYRRKIIENELFVIFSGWISLYIIFFTLNAINLSEYYINGMNVVWILIFSLFISRLLSNKKFRNLGVIILVVFLFTNILKVINTSPNQSGYLHRKAVVDYIYDDAKRNNYPCVSVSYIVSPGNDFGYRYFFYLKKMHVNQPKSGSPVYTIVFPHSKVDRLDKTFGALGLVLPDYQRYNNEAVNYSCSGANANLTDPLFGYTQ